MLTGPTPATFKALKKQGFQLMILIFLKSMRPLQQFVMKFQKETGVPVKKSMSMGAIALALLGNHGCDDFRRTLLDRQATLSFAVWSGNPVCRACGIATIIEDFNYHALTGRYDYDCHSI